MLESTYQRKLVGKIEALIPGCVVMRNDPHQLQGVPDLLILYGDMWAMLEVKVDEEPRFEPNQLYYIEKLGMMSYVTCITPYNEEEVLNDLQSTFRSARKTRVSKSV